MIITGKPVGETEPKGQDRQGGIRLAGCCQNRAACDVQVHQSMNSAFSVNNPVRRAQTFAWYLGDDRPWRLICLPFRSHGQAQILKW